ncbi:PP2C family protein-serine/threonine phosphatase [Teredinibacter franksiae]|uniref:PP2C family protein-serine/threonine phosphatase n=1 Tax=Teredinibacter franksiae TaxID=2761453 RepID=UPI0028B18780|nr:protein phosphatase 2C domain-containing protein [Teredinibacter franksiae]
MTNRRIYGFTHNHFKTAYAIWFSLVLAEGHAHPSEIRMQLTHYHAATDVGLQRSNNEDCFLSMPFLGVWAVADGMGGHAAGEVASAIACDTIKREISRGASLELAIQNSHHAVVQAAENGIGGTGMGSTVVAVQSNANAFKVCWVGDSRAYSYIPAPNGHGDQLELLTRDHSYVQLLVDTGVIAQEEMATHPERNIITQCLGSADLEDVEVGSVEHSWQRNQWLVLCSDGLSDAVHEPELTQILAQSDSVKTATAALIQAALNNGGRDNITLQIISGPDTWSQWIQNSVRMVKKIIS